MTRLSWIAVSFLLVGCASSPSNGYYTLSVESPCPATVPLAHINGLDRTTVRLPGMLDRPQLVVRSGPQTLDIREFDRWAEPLDQMTNRVLAEDIARCQSPAASGKPRYALSVSVDEFMADTSGQAYLTGRWWIVEEGDKSRGPGHSFSLRERIDQARAAERAAAMSVLLGRLAGEIVRWSSLSENSVPARPST